MHCILPISKPYGTKAELNFQAVYSAPEKQVQANIKLLDSIFEFVCHKMLPIAAAQQLAGVSLEHVELAFDVEFHNVSDKGDWPATMSGALYVTVHSGNVMLSSTTLLSTNLNGSWCESWLNSIKSAPAAARNPTLWNKLLIRQELMRTLFLTTSYGNKNVATTLSFTVNGKCVQHTFKPFLCKEVGYLSSRVCFDMRHFDSLEELVIEMGLNGVCLDI